MGLLLGLAFKGSVISQPSPLTVEFYSSLSYYLTYRIVTPQALEMMLLAFQATPVNPVAEMGD